MMNEKSARHLEEVLKRIEDPVYCAEGLKRDRKHIADILRAARIRVKANKARNGGIYIPAK